MAINTKPTHAERAADYRNLYPMHTGPHRDGQANANTQATEFAKLLVNALVLLNGGSLVAFPTLFQVVGVDFKAHLGAIIALAVFLVVGLVCAFCAGIAGFFALAKAADGGMKMVESAGYDAWVWSFDSPEYEPQLTKLKNLSIAAETEANQFFSKYGICRSLGISFVLASLGAFILAAGTGAYAVWQNA